MNAPSASGESKPRSSGSGPVGPRRAQRLLGAAEPRHEPVREREHLRRRAVVLLQPHDRRLREPRREPEQPLRRGAGEAVDRLVVVADRAEVVARPEPELEQRLLQQVDVLVLVDGEGRVALAERGERVRVLLVHPHRQLEQVLEVDRARALLAPLVLAEDPRHQVLRDRRLVAVQPVAVGLRGQPPVLRPLDLGGEVARRPEAVRRRQRVPDLAQQQRLGREDPPRAFAARPPQLRQRRRVERARLDPVRAEPRQPRAHLARGLVGEGDREDLVGAHRARRDLPGDPPRDRRRLPGAGAGEDADRPAHRLGSTPLLRVQPLEDHRATLARPVDGPSGASVPKPCRSVHRRRAARASSSRGARPSRASRPRAPAARARPARPGARPCPRSGRARA